MSSWLKEGGGRGVPGEDTPPPLLPPREADALIVRTRLDEGRRFNANVVGRDVLDVAISPLASCLT